MVGLKNFGKQATAGVTGGAAEGILKSFIPISTGNPLLDRAVLGGIMQNIGGRMKFLRNGGEALVISAGVDFGRGLVGGIGSGQSTGGTLF